MFRDYTLQTSGDRIMFALIGGAAVGAVFVTAFTVYVFSLTLDLQYPSFKSAATSILGSGSLLGSGAKLFAVAFASCGVGLVIVGCPVWFVLHRLGCRTRIAALTSGFFVSIIAGFWMGLEFFNPAHYALWATLGNSTIFGVIGSLTALTIWRIAYRKPAEDV